MNKSSDFILASASPRRKKLLREAGYSFDIIPSQVDESAFPTEGIASDEHTMLLAAAKARNVANTHPDRLVLGADTIVDLNGQIIGKPRDAAHAEQITRDLFSEPHKVITGLALVRLSDNLEIIRHAVTTVYPRKLTEQQIADHIAAGDWQGKAGAYGIQETGDEFVERIEGSFTNVIGLPLELVKELLDPLLSE
ncbi:Maf-like protein YhdE [Anaerohalosphaera lusitana]|uniref:dTTP/UTP pyrophosphatase n=1 Tax=Anaerohalosphaera lusitana TaxID=1936003 RepID=A0A1U9NP09_9BACT|nr:Maf family protein [Anaerohalosphaera lusitana]AQT69651.1 Maf-like protein YhdE [Anaerohalosphaera lusitana]